MIIPNISPAYSGQSAWRPASALVTTLIILFVSVYAVPTVLLRLTVSDRHASELSLWGGSTYISLLQYCTLGLLVWIASGMGSHRSKVLCLNWPEDGSKIRLLVISAALSALLPLSFIVREFVGPGVSFTNALFQGPPSPLQVFFYVVIYVILTPLVEEFLFRGFLLSAIQKTRLGFWGGSVLATTLWTALHFTLPAYAIVTVALSGVILSVALWITGSIWTCVIIHAFYNAYSLIGYLMVLILGSYLR